MARDPEKLTVFHAAHDLVLRIYRLTAGLPDTERFGLQMQLRRAAVSIAANVVEGTQRRSASDDARFLDMAVGSAAEVRYLLRLVRDLELLPAPSVEECRNHSEHVARALQNLRRAVAQFPRR